MTSPTPKEKKEKIDWFLITICELLFFLGGFIGLYFLGYIK